MPAGLPGSNLTANLANPSAGMGIMFDLLSGPKGSPFDKDMTGNVSTGALATGIGFGPNTDIPGFTPGVSTASLNYVVGATKPDGSAATDSTLMYIGGGKCSAVSNGLAAVAPYTAGFGVGMAGNGGARDGGTGPAFTGFTAKVATAAAAVAPGANVITGTPNFVNRSGVTIPAGASQFAVSSAASPAVA